MTRHVSESVTGARERDRACDLCTFITVMPQVGACHSLFLRELCWLPSGSRLQAQTLICSAWPFTSRPLTVPFTFSSSYYNRESFLLYSQSCAIITTERFSHPPLEKALYLLGVTHHHPPPLTPGNCSSRSVLQVCPFRTLIQMGSYDMWPFVSGLFP